MLLSKEANTEPTAPVLHDHMQKAYKNNHIPLTRLMCYADFGSQSSRTLHASSPVWTRNVQHELGGIRAQRATCIDTHQEGHKKPSHDRQTLRAQFSSPLRQKLPREPTSANNREPCTTCPRTEGPVNCDGVFLDRLCPPPHTFIRGLP